MDLKKLSPRSAADPGAVMHLKDPATGEGLMEGDKPVTITLRGADSQALKDKTKELELRRAQGEDIDEAQAGAEKLACLVIDWFGLDADGEPIPCTFGDAVKLFLHPDTEWIVGQVFPFSKNRRNYLGNRRTG